VTTVFVTGAFDVIHRGHIDLLRYAYNLGDKLIVALDADFRVTSMKGPNRPYHNISDRITVMEAIRYVDEICVFGSDLDLINLIRRFSPDILVAGSDWKGKPIIGEQYAGEVRYFDRIDGYSTTGILKNDKNV